MDRTDIPYISATELAEFIRKREVSPIEAVEAYLERIESLNGKLNAFLTVCRDEALEAAQEAEQALSRGNYLGPMHGIPVAVKDQVYTKGIRTTLGSPVFADFVPDEDATVIAKLKAAGAILLGKLNIMEFGTTGFSH
jgi:Asp-tRNA(Asn)/Glu-tRNA(Gln) amidotransferase A subunit family amidase